MRAMLYIADLPLDLGVVKKPFSRPLKVPVLLGTSDVMGVLGRIAVVLSNAESWLPNLRVDGDTLGALVPM